MRTEKLVWAGKTVSIGAVVGGIGLLGSALVDWGNGIDSTYGVTTYTEAFDVVDDKIADANSKVIIYEQRADTLEQSVGVTCLHFLKNYSYDGPLGNTEEGEIVDDLYTNVEKPCGDDPTEVRKNVAIYKAADTAKKELQEADLNGALAERVELDEELQRDRDFNWALEIAGIGFGIAALLYVLNNPIPRRSKAK